MIHNKVIINILLGIIISSIIAIIILDIREHNNYVITNIINPSNCVFYIQNMIKCYYCCC